MELLKESLEKKEVQISEVLKATNLDPSAMSSLTKRLEEVLGQKNTHIKELQYDLSKVTKVMSFSLVSHLKQHELNVVKIGTQ